MIYHQIRFTVKPDAPKEQVDTAFELLHRIGRELDVVESFCVGRDVGGEFEYGALYVLKDIDAYRTYMNAPLHRQTDEAGLPIVDKMVSMDLTDDSDPEIDAKIAEVHSTRFAGDPGLVDLVEGLGSYEGSGTTGRD
jgi:Stress responsive A/B Barrel Domain